MKTESRLDELGIKLVRPLEPIANYISVQRYGRLLFTSGSGPFEDGKIKYCGKLGLELSKEDGYAAARLTAVNIISTLKARLGDLDLVEQILKITGYVASTPGFVDMPAVINGASDLLVEVFGDRGRHARTAVSAPALPMNTPVEIEAVILLSKEFENK